MFITLYLSAAVIVAVTDTDKSCINTHKAQPPFYGVSYF